MSESTFAERTRAAFERVLELSRQPEVVAEYRGNLLTMRFANGHRSTLTRQDSIEQVWLADGVLTWQFEDSPDDPELRDAVDGQTMSEVVARMVRTRSRRPTY